MIFKYRIIIDKVAPTFTKQLPKIVATDGKEILRSLNSIQRTAVLKALTSNEFLLLKGLPGNIYLFISDYILVMYFLLLNLNYLRNG